MRMATSALVLTLAGAAAWTGVAAQTPAPPKPKAAKKPATADAQQTAERWPLHAVTFKGSKVFKPEQLMALSGLKLETLVSRDDFEKARDRLYETGCLDAVAYVYEPVAGAGIQVTFEVGDVEERGGWRIEGLKLDPKEYAARASKVLPVFGPEIPLTEIYGRHMSDLAQTMLQEKGAQDTVILKFEAGMQGGMVAVLRSKTPPPNIAEVIFKGAKAVAPQDVQKVMAGVAVGTPWDEQMFRTFLESTARALYDSYGRLGAKFTSITTEPSKSGRGIAVIVTVEEGPVYKLRQLDIVGAPMREEEVNSLGGDSFRNGVTANFRELGRGMTKVIERAKELGYLKATYHFTKQLNDEDKTVDVRIEVEPGTQYKMGRLDIDGLDMEAEPVIRKLWAMKLGDPYRAGYPEMFLAQVRQRRILDYLGATNAETKVNDERAEVDVRLTFKGGPQQLDSRPRDSHGEVIQQPGEQAPPK